MIHFAHPHVLWLLVPLFAVALWLAKRGRPAAIAHSNVDLVRAIAKTRRSRWGRLLMNLQWLAAALFIIALARPSRVEHHTEVHTSGVDVMLAIDVSESMQTPDMQSASQGEPISRLAAAKQVVTQFVDARPNDRIGVVAFSGKPYLASPLTLDHDWVRQSLGRLNSNDVSNGTAIGTAIAAGVNRLDSQNAKSRVLVLLTDGQNNAGNIQPIAAAEAARSLGVKVYTIGVGSSGETVVRDDNGKQHVVDAELQIDEQTLKQVAERTGGLYFRATDPQSLASVYATIDKLEKTTRTLKQQSKRKEQFAWFVIPGLFALMAQLGLSATRFRRIPG